MCWMIYLHVYLCTKCMQVPPRIEEDIRPSRIGAVNGCEVLSGCWELNQGPLEKWNKLLTAEPFFNTVTVM